MVPQVVPVVVPPYGHDGAAGDAGSGAALWPRWCRCSNSGLKASLAWLVIKIGIS